MLGATLSRWTMSYFAAALCALIGAEALMAAGYGFPSAPLRAPETLFLVHLVVIGWLSLLLCGALLQFVPVLIARPLYSDTLSLPALGFLLTGLGGLLGGFLQLAGTLDLHPSLLPFAAVALAAGFGLTLYNLGRTLAAARPLPLAARFVGVALLSLAATVTLGLIFAFALSLPISNWLILAIAGAALPLHVAAGIGGWLTFAAIGVSYRLLAMFMLAPELEGARPHMVLRLGAAALAVTILGGIGLLLANASISPALLLGGLLSLVALGLYGADILHLYRARKRRIIELNSEMTAFALASLAAAAALALILAGLQQFSGQVGALVFLILFGWLTGLGLAKLYKIVAFLTWLECYGPVLGKAATPRVQDLVAEGQARGWFFLYYAATWAATVALLASSVPLFRLAAAAMTIATAAITVQLVRTRRLSNIPGPAALPGSVHRPRLLISLPESS